MDAGVWDQAGQGYGWFQMFHGWSAFALEIATLQSMLHAATEMELELQLHAARLPLGPFWSLFLIPFLPTRTVPYGILKLLLPRISVLYGQCRTCT